jgi:hypothetical protein
MSFHDFISDDADLLFDPEELGTIADGLSIEGERLFSLKGLLRTPTQAVALGKSAQWLPRSVTFLTAANQLPVLALKQGDCLAIHGQSYRLTHAEDEGNGLLRLHLDATAANTPDSGGLYFND